MIFFAAFFIIARTLYNVSLTNSRSSSYKYIDINAELYKENKIHDNSYPSV